MAIPINLNKARKAKVKAAAEALAVENRVRFGRTKAEKTLDQAQAAKTAKALEQSKRES